MSANWSIVATAAALLLLVVCAILSSVEAAQSPLGAAFIVKRRQIEDIPEALKILRRFMNVRLTPEQRCERYAVLLNKITTSKTDQIGIAELGLGSPDKVKERYSQLGFENLRQLYIDGIKAFTPDTQVDRSMIELVECLGKFRTTDARARSFLNDEQLKQTVAQYETIMSEPLEFLIAGEPSKQLTGDQLTPAVKTTVRNVFLGDDAKVEQCFPSAAGYFGRAPGAGARPFSARFVPQANSDAPEVPLVTLGGTLGYLYTILPAEATLEQRCSAYSHVLEEPADHQGPELANEIAAYFQDNINEPPASLPLDNKQSRDTLMYALLELGPGEIGGGSFVDLVDCLAAWQYNDADVNTYLNSPELTDILAALTADEPVPADGGAVATATSS